ncbi:MAG: glyoxalase/bleomycin resistance/dioxygenase family protein [Proteobacteria bacterium]|nr:glyoxalase/bleomycin resistance/dioxygenase family protein [Pseudomonadota bacterium]
MTTPQFALAVRYVRDMPAARRFYVDVLGLKPQREHASFIQFAHFALASDAPLGDDRAAELCWLVDDIDAAWGQLQTQGRVRMPLTDLPFGRIFSIDDADGHPCYVMQWAAARPSTPT